jgi:hypothetical protein
MSPMSYDHGDHPIPFRIGVISGKNRYQNVKFTLSSQTEYGVPLKLESDWYAMARPLLESGVFGMLMFTICRTPSTVTAVKTTLPSG